MNSVQESKNELDAAIRYAENAISSAKQTIESMEFRQEIAKKQYSEQTGREKALDDENIHLQKVVIDLETFVEELRDDKVILNRKLAMMVDEVADLKVQRDKARLDKVCAPTMPVIPKAVAIAIFREGMAYGAGNVCDELDNTTDMEISDRECMGNFEVEYTQYVDLSDHLDTDYLRSKAVDNSDEEWVVDCLKSLCADNKFECRIHGVDDEEKKND